MKINIIGGGLAGLVSAYLLAQKGYEICLIEKKKYPFHRVCGEYVSNETLRFLKDHNLYPEFAKPSQINRFTLTLQNGQKLGMPLDLGAFGISRYVWDAFLVEKVKALGVEVLEQTSVIDVQFREDTFDLSLSNGQKLTSPIVIGAFGKKSVMDQKLKRKFAQSLSPFVGVKYHIRTDFPKNEIALHNFVGGYCGLSAVENDRYNLCYLGRREELKKHGGIPEMEQAVLYQNPYLKSVFENSEFLFEQPVVINAFSFAPKQLIENNMLMAGDAAGLITPLCGNGMAMAIHSAKILSECIIQHTQSNQVNRVALEEDYRNQWRAHFEKRLWVGRQTQKLFGTNLGAKTGMWLMRHVPLFATNVMKNTHGEPF